MLTQTFIASTRQREFGKLKRGKGRKEEDGEESLKVMGKMFQQDCASRGNLLISWVNRSLPQGKHRKCPHSRFLRALLCKTMMCLFLSGV